MTWVNWGRTVECQPGRVLSPGGADDLAALVTECRSTGDRIKAVGAGHSFSPIAAAPSIQIELSRMRGLVRVDPDLRQVTLWAGTHLHEIPGLLAPHGLAMANLGDVDRQTIAGATSTGTHGTGLAFGGISTQIVSATIVSGTGEIVTVDTGSPDLPAVALGLGALGLLVDVTLQCVPAFSIRADERPLDIDDAIDGFLDRVAEHDHHEFYMFAHSNRALGKINTRLDGVVAPSGPSAIRRYIDDELLSNRAFGLLCELSARLPVTASTINEISGRVLSARTYTDSSTKVFISERNVRFREMEYALPLDAVPGALREIRSMIGRRKYRVSFPIEVRAAAADDLMLSTASGRNSGYIAVHRYINDDAADTAAYFADVEAIMTAHDGRPHWGKMHTRDAAYLRSAYPRFDEFLAVRDRLDPDRVFTNDYLDRVLGA
ncbi:FAD-binding protein [Gordonia desulfuricans]|uniref:FAD-binding protein n=1 Tax=Gordonia desulfuricans TaxID=89051 RepID=A0A7K3LRK5_9ACTN|nr:D-arabinono-1,4-lactone oxidase [Gordonia desulfuricans]NDK90848.1 FAD-binding protein [Gordonia desulfuricans]